MPDYSFSEVYQDEDEWWRFNVTTPSGEVVESDEYNDDAAAKTDLEYIRNSEAETIKFIEYFKE